MGGAPASAANGRLALEARSAAAGRGDQAGPGPGHRATRHVLLVVSRLGWHARRESRIPERVRSRGRAVSALRNTDPPHRDWPAERVLLFARAEAAPWPQLKDGLHAARSFEKRASERKGPTTARRKASVRQSSLATR